MKVLAMLCMLYHKYKYVKVPNAKIQTGKRDEKLLSKYQQIIKKKIPNKHNRHESLAKKKSASHNKHSQNEILPGREKTEQYKHSEYDSLSESENMSPIKQNHRISLSESEDGPPNKLNHHKNLTTIVNDVPDNDNQHADSNYSEETPTHKHSRQNRLGESEDASTIKHKHHKSLSQSEKTPENKHNRTHTKEHKSLPTIENSLPNHDDRYEGLTEIGKAPNMKLVYEKERIARKDIVSLQTGNSASPKLKSHHNQWPVRSIPCHEGGVFHAQLGPSADVRGINNVSEDRIWDVTWYINGMLIPEISVVRGKEYTFYVEGGSNPNNDARYHPFYITDDPLGGYAYKTKQEQKNIRIFAGARLDLFNDTIPMGLGRYCSWAPDPNAGHIEVDRFKTFEEYQDTLVLLCEKGKHGEITWIPDASTPDTVYYQCLMHVHPVWKINVLDNCDNTVSKRKHVEKSKEFTTETFQGDFIRPTLANAINKPHKISLIQKPKDLFNLNSLEQYKNKYTATTTSSTPPPTESVTSQDTVQQFWAEKSKAREMQLKAIKQVAKFTKDYDECTAGNDHENHEGHKRTTSSTTSTPKSHKKEKTKIKTKAKHSDKPRGFVKEAQHSNVASIMKTFSNRNSDLKLRRNSHKFPGHVAYLPPQFYHPRYYRPNHSRKSHSPKSHKGLAKWKTAAPYTKERKKFLKLHQDLEKCDFITTSKVPTTRRTTTTSKPVTRTVTKPETTTTTTTTTPMTTTTTTTTTTPSTTTTVSTTTPTTTTSTTTTPTTTTQTTTTPIITPRMVDYFEEATAHTESNKNLIKLGGTDYAVNEEKTAANSRKIVTKVYAEVDDDDDDISNDFSDSELLKHRHNTFTDPKNNKESLETALRKVHRKLIDPPPRNGRVKSKAFEKKSDWKITKKEEVEATTGIQQDLISFMEDKIVTSVYSAADGDSEFDDSEIYRYRRNQSRYLADTYKVKTDRIKKKDDRARLPKRRKYLNI